MPLGEMIDDPTSNDDYVAQLLASEAKDKSLKYSALGLKAYLPRRPTDRAPKPNTRFLKNILRDTDTHNAALRRKEEEDVRERMRKLRGERSPPSHRDRCSDKDRRYRDRSPHRRDKERSSRREHVDASSGREHKSRSERHRRRYKDDDDSESDRNRQSSSRSHRRRDDDRRSKRSRHRSSRHHRDDRSESPRRSLSRSRSPDSRRRRDSYKDYERREEHSTGDNSTLPNARRDAYSLGSESDPLDDIVGPLPASAREKASSISTRGRGSYRQNTSTIDSHFARDYDPKLDVDISDNDEISSSKRLRRRPVAGLMTKDEDEDWNMALEALRDRANWRQKGEERLRAAGFDESTVQRWKEDPAFTNGGGVKGDEGRIEDVKWAKKGEGREWDRGKVLNEHGHYDVKAEW
ncbi:conserved hypothetical protein [Talaromyces stipitatus ATCC 10500]|uniref:Pre-mRNA-splicing factor 38B n=1 Tax=Talaromyces stipitatus (strain ATCC 10500 / CBS 375.48 / QM 6759 / NRRL 1006) TaxID=441959 RepID=B8MMK9_TALSN|nr:uncharacterized protein TSTA_100090 [Talaromyces stipitatus ATCC 10500]EED13763.1 conserved hypothetical protein [Talaromyces stipitatus ATCC 10500]